MDLQSKFGHLSKNMKGILFPLVFLVFCALLNNIYYCLFYSLTGWNFLQNSHNLSNRLQQLQRKITEKCWTSAIYLQFNKHQIFLY